MAELQAQRITGRIPDHGSRYLEFRVTGPRLCPYQPPATAHTGYALVLLVQVDTTSGNSSQQSATAADSTSRCTRGSVAWDLEQQACPVVAYTVPLASDIVVSLHDPRTSWSPLQTYNQAALPESEGGVLLYMSVEDAVLKTPVQQVLRGTERMKAKLQALQLPPSCLRVGVFKAWNAAGAKQPAKKAGCGSQRVFSFVQLLGTQAVPAAFAARFQSSSSAATQPGTAPGSYLTDSYATQQVHKHEWQGCSAGTGVHQEQLDRATQHAISMQVEQDPPSTDVLPQGAGQFEGSDINVTCTSTSHNDGLVNVTQRVRHWQLSEDSAPGPLAVARAALAESAAAEVRAKAAKEAPPVNKSARWQPGSSVARAKAAMVSALPSDVPHPSSSNRPPTRLVSAHTEGVIDSSTQPGSSYGFHPATVRTRDQGLLAGDASPAVSSKAAMWEQRPNKGAQADGQSRLHSGKRQTATPLGGATPAFSTMTTQESLARARTHTQALVADVARMEEELRFTRGV